MGAQPLQFWRTPSKSKNCFILWTSWARDFIQQPNDAEMMVFCLYLIHFVTVPSQIFELYWKKHFLIKNDPIITTLQYLKDFT